MPAQSLHTNADFREALQLFNEKTVQSNRYGTDVDGGKPFSARIFAVAELDLQLLHAVGRDAISLLEVVLVLHPWFQAAVRGRRRGLGWR